MAERGTCKEESLVMRCFELSFRQEEAMWDEIEEDGDLKHVNLVSFHAI